MDIDDDKGLTAELEDILLDAVAQEAATLPTDVLAQMQHHGERVLKLDRLMAYVESQMSRLKAIRRELVEVTLPALFEQVPSVPFVLLENGAQKLVYKKDVLTSIPEDKRDFAFKWLRENKHGGIIKHEMTVNFLKGQGDSARILFEGVKVMEGVGSASLKEAVHPSTLKSWGLEVLAAGTELPDEGFTLFVVKEAQIKEVKETAAQKKRREAMNG